ncbi:MAG: hypothetical protein FWG73_03340 [Planctomycetaceae bacterium]|nr:hypothetical protein [Planctomycetaceae bacterium]
MTHELILTSTARGLNPKDCGFCPIAMDKSLPAELAKLLSALSNQQYRQLVAAEPVLQPLYSHLILPDSQEHVLSRTAATGLDYQNQPNVLAHHIILDPAECVPEGPAWLLALPGFHLSLWNEPPLQFSQGRTVPTLTNLSALTRRQQIARQFRWLDPQKMSLSNAPPDPQSAEYLAAIRRNDEQATLSVPPTSPCPAWAELTGDPGWGGVLAETVFSGKPAVLIYRPEQNILPLFVEALALLPSQFAWRTTFCTNHLSLSPDLAEMLPCQWQGVVAGSTGSQSAESDSVMRTANALLIDLTAPLGAAPAGRYVEFARHGQEHMLPLDIEYYSTDFETDDAECDGTSSDPNTATQAMNPLAASPSPVIQLPKKYGGLLDSLLRRSSRSQFYFLYSIMFALVLFLLVLAIDQVGHFGLFQGLRNTDNALQLPPIDEMELEPIAESELDHIIESALDHSETDQITDRIDREHSLTQFAADRETQKLPLLEFLNGFAVPEYLAINFPEVQDDQIDVPGDAVFRELHPLEPFGAAIDLRYIPLFNLSGIPITTELVLAELPELVWEVQTVDTQTRSATAMFRFHWTQAGLEMRWLPEGLSNQHLYDTVLLSLGFLELNVADELESAMLIPLFAPMQTEAVRLADLTTAEYAVELPFASELWQRIFAAMNPPMSIVLEVETEAADGLRILESSASDFHGEVQTSQQIQKQTEDGRTVYENIAIQFTASASLDRVAWKLDDYAERLEWEKARLMLAKTDLENRIDQLRRQAFEGNDSARTEREDREVELRKLNGHIGEIDGILAGLPTAYDEIGRTAESFLYAVFLASADGERRLAVLVTR